MTKKELIDIILWINQNGWSPATSTNYSIKNIENKVHIFISKSGVDKSIFTENDLLEMTLKGEKLPEYANEKSSAETDIHLTLYQHTSANAILHTHSIADTVLSRFYGHEMGVELYDYELLKGLKGIDTHKTSIFVPIFENTQNIPELCEELKDYMDDNNNEVFLGFLIEGHGFYTWGDTLKEAKTHLEVFQFLFSCELEELKMD